MTQQPPTGTLLVLSTFPIKKPVHGGQLRSSALVSQYKKSFKKVIRSAVFNSSVYHQGEFSTYDIPSPPEVTQDIVSSPELEVWILGESVLHNSWVKNRILSLLEKSKPDYILFEQPFLYSSVKKLLEEKGLQIPLIYSSHNIESELMKDIFVRTHKMNDYAPKLVELEKAEKELSETSVGCISVTQQDAATLEKWGATNVVIQGNGGSPSKASRLKRLRVRRVMKQLNINSYALFIASSHRPNVDGFIETLGTRLGYLPADTKIFLAGEVGRALHPEVSRVDPEWSHLFWNRVFNWDRVSNKTLSALIAESRCIILPVTTGGGSNLKTAEAVMSLKPVVGTTQAFRGFEQLKPNPLIFVSETPEVFQKNLVTLLKNSDELQQSHIEKAHWDLSWNSQLAIVPQFLNQLKEQSS